MAQVHHDTHALPMGNYVIGVGNYVIVSPSKLGNYKIADIRGIISTGVPPRMASESSQAASTGLRSGSAHGVPIEDAKTRP